MFNIRKKVLIHGVLAVAIITIGFVPILHAAKVTICHIPPGNEANAHDITISENALQAHLEHGDFNGTCDNQPAPEICTEGEICAVEADVCVPDNNTPLDPSDDQACVGLCAADQLPPDCNRGGPACTACIQLFPDATGSGWDEVYINPIVESCGSGGAVVGEISANCDLTVPVSSAYGTCRYYLSYLVSEGCMCNAMLN